MNQKHRTRKPRRAPVAWIMGALVVLVAALLVGCGGSSSDSSSEESGTASSGQACGPGGFAEISEETRACLEEQGVELPDPGEGPSGGGPPEGGPPAGFGEGAEEMREALEECGAELPEGRPGGPPMDSGAFRE